MGGNQKSNVKIITSTSFLLAICIVSQFIKNANIYITGSIINACLIIATIYYGIYSGVIISFVTPITSFFITGSPIIMAIPIIMPLIMIGNIILVICVGLLKDKYKKLIMIPMVIGVLLKSIFMGITISLFIISFFLPEKLLIKKEVFQMTFSFVQLITGLIGAGIASVILKALSGRSKCE